MEKDIEINKKVIGGGESFSNNNLNQDQNDFDSSDNENIDTTDDYDLKNNLFSTIWYVANDLRGSVDGWDFKSYILGTLFYRFISENLEHYINSNEIEAGDENFDYSKITDEEAEEIREEIIKEKGFFILPSQLFKNVTKNAKNNENLNETLSKVFNDIEKSAIGTESEDNFKGLFDDINLNSNKLGGSVIKRNELITKILQSINEFELNDDYNKNSIDIFGDAYEYLMCMYASNAGKSGGEYFTPQEVSKLLTKIAIEDKKEVNKVYDPCCGSGSLLLQAAKILGKDRVKQGFYGQEINRTTYNLCRINMFLHNINYTKFNIACEDTLINPQHDNDQPFDVIVSNPPYSIRWEGDSNPILINDNRFSPAGVLAPKSNADLAFTMHMLSYLSVSGTAAIVEFPGILYRSGAEQKIRQYLIDNNYIDTVIQLPNNIFFGTSITTCILVLKKSKNNNDVLFIDASNEFIHVGNKNKLSDDNIEKIYNTYRNRQDIDDFAKVVSNKEIADNNYNIAISAYIKHNYDDEIVIIEELNKEINEAVERINKLRLQVNNIIADLS